LLRDLRLACLRDAPDAFGSGLARERDRDEAGWRDRLAASAWFVAEVDGRPAGLVRGALPRHPVPGRRHLHSMWVHPAHRGAGVGAALIAAVRQWAVSDGGAELVLWVIEGNAAASGLYARAGFAPTGVRQRLPDRPCGWEQQWARPLP
jgi:GNAT superfamily N-acetyltransferase